MNSEISTTDQSWTDVPCDVMVLAINDDEDGGPCRSALERMGLASTPGATRVVPAPSDVAARVVVAVRLPNGVDLAILRDAIASGVGEAIAVPTAATIGIYLGPVDTEQLAAVSEGAMAAQYIYRFNHDRRKGTSREVIVCVGDAADGVASSRALFQGREIARAIAMVRDWVNMPPNVLTPTSFADQIVDSLPSIVRTEVWSDADLIEHRCTGTLTVGASSVNPPRLVTATYEPEASTGHLVLVGKGITFDSGGLSLKDPVPMRGMKLDMGGAAVAVASVWLAARLGLPLKVTCITPLAENMPSGSAMRPGDVLEFRNGKTVEVLNTDEEGRLVLADALILAADLEPTLIVDMATLTGHCVIGLGAGTSGIFSNSRELQNLVHRLAEGVGESMWPMPITPIGAAGIRSSRIADLSQTNPQNFGGAIHAAAFLREFVSGHDWVHIDMAGSVFNPGAAIGPIPSGATGHGVRTVVALMAHMVKEGASEA